MSKVSIEEQMDEARIPYAAQRQSIPNYERCEGLRIYTEEVRSNEPVGINFALVANGCNTRETELTPQEAKSLVWVFAKELILSHRTVRVMNPRNLADQLTQVKPWEEEFTPDYADHLILTNFFRAGQPSPYKPRELSLLIDYIGQRFDYGKTTHTFWEFREHDLFAEEADEWYPRLWVDFWFAEQQTKWITRR
jgi:hypothetical protein